MEIISRGNEVEVRGIADFDPEKIFTCGQCFRWHQGSDGAWYGVAGGKACRVRKEGKSVFFTASLEDFDGFWRDYFDLDRDYAKLRQRIAINDYFAAAADFGAGIRILNQDPWEALCSFIISACNNIPRIMKIVETLCTVCGEPIHTDWGTVYAFPTAQAVLNMTEEEMASLRCGYRAASLRAAAEAVCSGKADLAGLVGLPHAKALAELKKFRGVGDKVAGCVMLFSLRITDAFPIDVWIRRAIDEHCGAGFDPGIFGADAGLAQQYMFYYQREKGA